jgi:hypothetical protein
MSYLKIFPRSITVKKDGSGGYVGRMTYDFEQYGRMLYDDDTDVELQCRWQPHADWMIRPTVKVHRLTGFSMFIHAMNHYLFEVLQFDPVSQWSKVSATYYEYYFERVYFDMGTQQFNVVKKEVAYTGESSQSFFREKIRS